MHRFHAIRSILRARAQALLNQISFNSDNFSFVKEAGVIQYV